MINIEWLGFMLIVVALLSFALGHWAGLRAERSSWTGAALNAPADHVRCNGRDYLVMTLDRFYRDYHNPLAAARFVRPDGRPA